MSAERVEAILAAHQYATFGTCTGCDWRVVAETHWSPAEPTVDQYPDQHRAHIAALVAAETDGLAERVAAHAWTLGFRQALVANGHVPKDGNPDNYGPPTTGQHRNPYLAQPAPSEGSDPTAAAPSNRTQPSKGDDRE